MTDSQKSNIDRMRQEGYGYAKIAQVIGASENTVKSYCRRQKSFAKKEEPNTCAECGCIINITKRCSRRFCSDACRTKWWNKHPKSEMPYSAVCACCGKEMSMRRKNEKKYCSHRCYITARYKKGGSND